ncbi:MULTISPECIES: hypothetical protein [Amycolatopsis]|uniref:Uncharacterized protein n=2 Tax=Amycolatopsis TaxID=1813 RepID=A0A1I3WMV8_9PSEU|nr:hypothetical protein [Amycolatopsis sacchari]SFK08509.1 hypothetical protein SAMN05421835_113130 [Amycolatopsis sacchari]
MISCLVAALPGGWLLLTVLAALPRVGPVLRLRLPRWLSPLVPTWTFFAPHPGTVDHVLCYRDRLANGTVSALREVWPAGRPRGRAGKAVDDAVSLLIQANGVIERARLAGTLTPAEVETRRAGLLISTSYLLLLTAASRVPHDATAVGVQFCVVATSRRDEPPRLVYASAVHQVDARPRWAGVS